MKIIFDFKTLKFAYLNVLKYPHLDIEIQYEYISYYKNIRFQHKINMAILQGLK